MDLYGILGLQKDASSEEIRTAYRSIANKCHPDKPNGSEETFKQVKHAYEVLIDPDHRAYYDRTGTSSLNEASKRDAKANEFLVSMLYTILDNPNINPDIIDIVQVIRDSIDASILGIKNINATITQQVARREKVIKKIKKKTDGDNILSMALDRRNIMQRKALEDNESSIEDLNYALIKLKDYEYDFVKVLMNPQVFNGMTIINIA